MLKEREIKQKIVFASADVFGGSAFNIINCLYLSFLALTFILNLYLALIIKLELVII